MARPLRLEYPDAVYHVMNRGAARQPVFLTQDDRKTFLQVLEAAWSRWRFEVYAYCLMGNHYHLCPDARSQAFADHAAHQRRLHPAIQQVPRSGRTSLPRPLQGPPHRGGELSETGCLIHSSQSGFGRHRDAAPGLPLEQSS